MIEKPLLPLTPCLQPLEPPERAPAYGDYRTWAENPTDTQMSTNDNATTIGVAADEQTIFKILASETTRRVLERLYRRPHTGTELADELEISQQLAHYHLSKLQDCGLITVEREAIPDHGGTVKYFAPVCDAIVAPFDYVDETAFDERVHPEETN